MPRLAEHGRAPRWAALYETAAGQAGYFTLGEANEAGYSSQLLNYYLRIGRVERWGRGLFRLVQFPASEREELVPVWLWSDREGVFGLETALSIHELSDVLPAHHDLIVPASHSARRVRPPRGVHLYFDDVPKGEREWHGAVPVTTVARTLRDCVRHHVAPDVVRQAIAQAKARGLVSSKEARAIAKAAA